MWKQSTKMARKEKIIMEANKKTVHVATIAECDKLEVCDGPKASLGVRARVSSISAELSL
jgi:hypothetical protein